MPLPTKTLQPHKVYQQVSPTARTLKFLCGALLLVWALASLYFVPMLVIKANTAQKASGKFQVAAAMCGARPVSYLVEARSPSEAAAKLKMYEDAITNERAALTSAAALERRKS